MKSLIRQGVWAVFGWRRITATPLSRPPTVTRSCVLRKRWMSGNRRRSTNCCGSGPRAAASRRAASAASSRRASCTGELRSALPTWSNPCASASAGRRSATSRCGVSSRSRRACSYSVRFSRRIAGGSSAASAARTAAARAASPAARSPSVRAASSGGGISPASSRSWAFNQRSRTPRSVRSSESSSRFSPPSRTHSPWQSAQWAATNSRNAGSPAGAAAQHSNRAGRKRIGMGGGVGERRGRSPAGLPL